MLYCSGATPNVTVPLPAGSKTQSCGNSGSLDSVVRNRCRWQRNQCTTALSEK